MRSKRRVLLSHFLCTLPCSCSDVCSLVEHVRSDEMSVNRWFRHPKTEVLRVTTRTYVYIYVLLYSSAAGPDRGFLIYRVGCAEHRLSNDARTRHGISTATRGTFNQRFRLRILLRRSTLNDVTYSL